MKPLLRLFLLLLVVALAACQGPGAKGPDQNGPGDEDPQPLAGVITGALTDSTGAVVAGAQVTLGSTAITVAALEPATAQLVVTNEYGQFAFDVDSEGEYTLTTMLDNEGAFTRVTVERDADGNLTSNPITMQSAEFGAVAGTVVGNNDGAWAFLLGTSFLAAAHDDGEFIISRVPAGTYQLAPGLLGVRGKAVTVLVESGKVTTIDTPLAFGPIITGVEPGEFMAEADAWGDGDEEAIQIVLRGSGFGKSRGVAQLWYAGVPVNEHITSWSDEEIVLRMWRDNSYRTANNEDLRFTFYDVTGEAVSGRFGMLVADLLPYACSENWSTGESWVSVRVHSFGLAVEDAPVVVTVENGVARAALGAAASSQFRTNDRGCVNVYVEPDLRSRLPVHVNVSVEGVNLGHLVLSESASLTLDDYMFVYADADDTVNVSGQLLYAYTGQGVNDDGQFRLQIRDPYYGAILYDDQLAIDSSGRFSAPIGTNADPSGYYHLTVFHQDVALMTRSIEIFPVSSLGSRLVLDTDVFVYGHADDIVDVSGQLLYAHTGEGVNDDGQFRLTIEDPADGTVLHDVPLALDATGRFSVPIGANSGLDGHYYLRVFHQGVPVFQRSIWFTPPSTPGTTLILDTDEFIYANADDTVTVTGQLLYAHTGEGVNDDGQFRLTIEDSLYGAALYDQRLVIDASGRFSVPIGTISGLEGDYILTVFHRDVEIQRTSVWIYPLSRLGMTLVLDGEGYGYPSWDGPVFVTGSLLYSHNGTGVFDDGEFMVRIEQLYDGSYLSDMSLTLDSDGRFAISFTPALTSGFDYNLTIFYKGQAVASGYFWVQYDPQLNAIIVLDGRRFLLTDGGDTVNLTGRFLDTDTQEAVLDDGRFTAQIGRYYDSTILWEGALDLDASGRFSLPITSESAEPGSHRLSVFHMGAWITDVSFDLEPGPTVTVQATMDSSTPAYSGELAPNASVTLAVNVDAIIAAGGPALYLETDTEFGLLVDWEGSQYRGDYGSRFSLVSNEYWGWTGASPLSSGISPMAIDIAIECRGSCVIVHAAEATAYVTITNTSSVIRNATFYAYTEAFQDLGEPGNDTQSGAVPIAMPGTESGALETIGDLDYYEVVGEEGQVGTLTFYPGSLAVLYLETASGDHKAGPYGWGSPSIQVEAGDFIRVQASGSLAAVSAYSAYSLEIVME